MLFDALARQRPWLPPGVVLRAANQNQSIASGNRSLMREAVIQIGTSEPIWVTDEERRNVKYSDALRKKVKNESLIRFVWVHSLPYCVAVPHPTRLTPGHLFIMV